MALYYYLKNEAKTTTFFGRGLWGAFPKELIFSGHPLKLISCFFFSFGLGLLSWLVWPFLEWRAIYVPRFTDTEIIKPIPLPERGEIAGATAENLAYISDWLPQSLVKSHPFDSVKNYTLSIPRLEIFDAQVIFGGEDLSKGLIHYAEAALPGENGTAIVFGHSVLPQFFDPQNYKSIFSTLHTLEKGDEVLVNRDGVEYEYEIFALEIIDPEDFSSLEQRNDNSYLYLITCNPPGTYWKRLIVKAKLSNL